VFCSLSAIAELLVVAVPVVLETSYRVQLDREMEI